MTEIYNEITQKFLEEVSEKADLSTPAYDRNGDRGFYVELEYWSSLGEDCIIALVTDTLTVDDIIKEMEHYVDSFDSEEHASELYNLHGKYGTPTSLRALLEDADEQAKKLQEVYDIMVDIADKYKEMEEQEEELEEE